MSNEACPNCGANDFIYQDGYKICRYCDSKFKVETKSDNSSTISLQSDIDALLQKCKKEPRNAKKYANLILDIDPTNAEAKKYL